MNKISRVLLALSIVLVVFNCSNIKFLGTNRSDLYSEAFLKKIESIKLVYKGGKSQLAIEELTALDKATMRPSEIALATNLVGVIYFSEENYDQAIENFNAALANSNLDKKLNAQIYLNLAGSFYKKNDIEKTASILKNVGFRYLDGADFENFHKLNFTVSKANSDYDTAVRSLVWLLTKVDKLSDIKEHSYYAHLESMFLSLEQMQRYKLLEEFEDEESLIVGYLGILNARKLYYGEGKDRAEDQLEWVEDNFLDKFPELESLVISFKSKLNDKRVVDTNVIGLVLPLSGKKSKFAQRAMFGIDFALREFQKAGGKKFRIVVRDSEGSSEIGAHHVKELAEKHKAGIVIGGLFSKEAAGQFLEAKKQGLVFVSLSEVYLPKGQKSHLLVEIPGSVESQIDKLFKGEISQKLGNKGALLYPNDERGEAIVNEFWRKSKQLGIEVTDVLSYNVNQTDFRNEVKVLLGLKFQRERLEEYELYKEIHDLEKKSSARRIQTLKPQVDFDWIFIPSYPDKAIQILPSFAYYDAFNVNFIGTEAWRSKTLVNQFKRKGKLYFLSSPVESNLDKFQAKFARSYFQRARIIESRSFESFNIAHNLLNNLEGVTRTELDLRLKNQKEIKGSSGLWRQIENIWIKDLMTMSLQRGKVSKAVFTPKEVIQSESDENAEE